MKVERAKLGNTAVIKPSHAIDVPGLGGQSPIPILRSPLNSATRFPQETHLASRNHHLPQHCASHPAEAPTRMNSSVDAQEDGHRHRRRHIRDLPGVSQLVLHGRWRAPEGKANQTPAPNTAPFSSKAAADVHRGSLIHTISGTSSTAARSTPSSIARFSANRFSTKGGRWPFLSTKVSSPKNALIFLTALAR